MADLTLIDLYSQRDAIATYVKDWPIEKVLEWMKQYGTVTKIDMEEDDRAYSFRSKSGETSPFRFADDGTLVIFK